MSSKHKLCHRLLSLVLLVSLVCTMFTTTVFATNSGGNEASEAEGIGTSMYAVQTALSDFANRVVGANTNDKHTDHKLKEMNNVSTGVAGAFIGYGDTTNGFINYILATDSKSVTTTSYDAWMNVGDGGATYAYLRYGRLLTDLGLDETGNTASTDGIRSAYGMVVQGGHAVASFMPTVWDFSLKVLRTLNPFHLLSNNASVKSAMGSTDAFKIGDAKNVNGESLGSNSTGEDIKPDTGMSDTSAITMNKNGTNKADSVLKPAIKYISDLYEICYDFGIFTIIPFLFVILIYQILVNRNKSGIKPFIARLVFIAIGIPFLAIAYTATLDSVGDMVQEQNAGTKMVACTFVDFQSWVQKSRLSPPAALTSVGTNSDDNANTGSGGSANTDTLKALRNTTFLINRQSGYMSKTTESGLGIGDDDWYKTTDAYEVSADFKESEATVTSKSEETDVRQINGLLSRYRSGDVYQASAFESSVNAAVNKAFASEMGQSASTGNSGVNTDATVYQMYDETDEVLDWYNREMKDNRDIFCGNGGSWMSKKFNIFSNGSLQSNQVTNASKDITYKAEALSGNGFNPETKGGLSTISMYNFLSTSFDDSTVSIYSANNSSSSYTKRAHYAVNLIGSGALRVGFGANLLAALFAFSLIGLIYGLGIIIANLKRGLSMIMQIPFAMMGMMRSAVQVVVYVFAMCIELLATIFIYSFVCDLIVIFASIIETAAADAVNNTTAVIGGQLAFLQQILPEQLQNSFLVFTFGVFVIVALVCLLSWKCVTKRHGILCSIEYLICMCYRMVTAKELLPIFDAYMQKRKSLYVWDSVADGWHMISDVMKDTWETTSVQVVESLQQLQESEQKGVQTV